ncbi:MAG: hypothetical protein SH859_15280 [Hyphomicrobium aestuarii]|nr:hypothetical protein [Hyphomicrobium aestuarii]
MSAVIVDFVKVRSQRLQAQAAPLGLPAFSPQQSAVWGTRQTAATAADTGSAFQFWTGVSGARYVHSVYHLFECPPVEAANYVLVKRHEGGQRTVLAIGRAANVAASLNLAEIRQRASQLGANEVHVHLLAQGQDDSRRIEADLRGSLVIA